MKKYLTLVNKENQIKNNYLKNLKLVDTKLADNTPCQLEEITYQNYLLLKKELASKKIDISLASTYRTVEDQQAIWEEYKEKYGLDRKSVVKGKRVDIGGGRRLEEKEKK